MTKYTYTCLLGFAVLLTGCASAPKVALDGELAASLRGKTLVRTERTATPDFVAMTPTKGAFAMVGAFAAIAAGNDLVRENQVPAPAGAIGQGLGEELRNARGMRLVAAPLVVSSAEPEQVAAAAAGQAEYVLDVQTMGWSFGYYPTHWGSYAVRHGAQARLIDVAGKKVVAQGSCLHNPDYSDKSPTYDDLTANQAAGLKRELALAATECIAVLKRDILAL